MFFIIVFFFTFTLNSYVFTRGWQLLPPSFVARLIYSVLFTAFFSLFFIRMIYGRGSFSPTALFLNDLAFVWLIAVIYLAIAAFTVDVLRLLNHFTGIFSQFINVNPLKLARYTAFVTLFAVALLLLHGSFKFNNPGITSYTVEIDKPVPGGEMTIAFVSDIHLGYSINDSHLKKYVGIINSLDPDLVLITGDITDRTLAPLKRWNAGEYLQMIKSRHGVFAISGNHEFYGGERDNIYKYLREHGVKVLLDTTIIAGGVEIAGREDMTNRSRKSLSDILPAKRSTKPLILMDHQPFNLHEASDNDIDLQLSGHTHNGQFWPGNLIVSWIYELPYGFKKIGKTNYIVTSGIGLWGPKFRIGTVSEVVEIIIKENKNQ